MLTIYLSVPCLRILTDFGWRVWQAGDQMRGTIRFHRRASTLVLWRRAVPERSTTQRTSVVLAV